jgi:alpha-ketoglutarate-dependent taurine dioxygenase
MARWGVLLVRGSEIDEAQQLEFTRALGEITGHRLGRIGGRPPEGADPNVFYLSHEPVPEPEMAGADEGSLGWHTDLEYMTEPQVYSVLCGVEVPAQGGETEYANLGAAYDALDEATRRQVDGLRAERRFTRRLPPVVHPLVRVLPGLGRRTLYLSPGLTRKIEGWDEPESGALLRRLFAHVTEERFCWRHRWRKGDVLLWDNRLTIHRRHPFDPRQRRVVRRTQTVGEPVVGVS